MDLDSLRLLQTQILQRLSELEACMLPSGQQQHSNISPTLYQQGKAEEDEEDNENIHHCTTMESRISHILRSGGVGDFEFKRVPSDYYERSLEERRDIVGAPSIDHLCKSIVLTNTQAHASVTDCSDPKNSKYYVVVIQYTARLNAENVKNFLHTLNNGKIPKKKFNFPQHIFMSFSHVILLGETPSILSNSIASVGEFYIC
ncbi:hypothetical protein AMTR_s00010p00069750 [Amborella trichopoda]|uniref:YbaK/aminoacyl-tRNA synthetase-associated domain-containing protein n=1 Tax=Amborella trichopoda TaxID=13333 RepID=W1NE49_AMBTC|nr:hypothetical protein AMTR_s00010p00069750 [Amborella trichopoda]